MADGRPRRHQPCGGSVSRCRLGCRDSDRPSGTDRARAAPSAALRQIAGRSLQSHQCHAQIGARLGPGCCALLSRPLAFGAARRTAEESGSLLPPKHILNAPTRLMKQEGYESGYAYDHKEEEAFSGQNYFPDGMARQSFYAPTGRDGARCDTQPFWKKKVPFPSMVVCHESGDPRLYDDNHCSETSAPSTPC